MLSPLSRELADSQKLLTIGPPLAILPGLTREGGDAMRISLVAPACPSVHVMKHA
jgi:hypothetical protein